MARLHPFTAAAVARVPRVAGAYFLYCGLRPVFAGVACGGATLRDELSAHRRGDFGASTRDATHFSWRGTPDAVAAYRIQLGAHARWDLRA